MAFFTKSLEEIQTEFHTDFQQGLTDDAVVAARDKFGSNELTAKKKKTFIQRFAEQLMDFMVIILIITAIISFAVALTSPEGDFIEPIVIVAIVLVNALLGVIQESKAEKALDALKSMAAPQAKTLRNGKIEVVPSAELVPGDIILLEAGDFIPADARLIEAASLKSDESALTGESVPTEKNAELIIEEHAPLGDRLNMIYSGCSVSYGRGKAVVVSTGMGTEMGKIAKMLDGEKDSTTPLQQKLAGLGKILGIIALAICVVIFIVGIIEHIDPIEMFMTAISLAVAAIPEGLPAIVTIVLALGVQRMVKKNAIIRKLPAVETLGSASVICSDKTGTLTQNRMTLVKTWTPEGGVTEGIANLPESTFSMLRMAALCCDGKVEIRDGDEKHIGDPTETAIVAAFIKCGTSQDTLQASFPRMGEIPFDSDRKLMTTINMIDGKPYAIVKGGPDILMSLCTSGDTKKGAEINEQFAKDALRVLAVGYKELDEIPASPTSEELENGLTFAGLIGMIDPPREEAKEAVATCIAAGIKPVMITGDHIVTASAIARQLGILKDESEAVSGTELAAMSDEELSRNIRNYSVYARVTPEDKIRIVKRSEERR